MDRVSDTIVLNVIDQILKDGTIPSIVNIADQDALPAAKDLFNNDVAGWAGNPLFLFLNYDAHFNNYIIESSDTYDTLAMLKAIKEYFGENGVWNNDTKELLLSAYDSITTVEATETIKRAGWRVYDLLEAAYGEHDARLTPSLVDVFFSNVVVGSHGDDPDVKGKDDKEDVIHAGTGNDTIFGSGEDDIIDGGAGVDVVDYRAMTDKVRVVAGK
ncbi:MAG: hypothetical protein EAZ52_07385 [Alphaproteobacteria bacterium]|nr:MAG: hypothetical protein EAZ66_04055 [Alphaproteobacteria bacterium]TAF75218.1 MAG: hypothetical protein EAZ52_07385 [Alphaproteobacteria bacterium]